ncbi:maleylpyruvate isomerase family mycothiol-dependent enzyme [Phycicoccus sp. BSK3Z-2]|uniref:Maleylpyruvate isomerase family mycothiol-dependent enzyme n=1 Tax=Phycicoccus avicenniae TaxID=2828860 RepID=A0A941I104_9MICO|nr:maleylpyruvate isomerase family mycothiol-dependent enzyme [Phycicoccus avicenniae]MBR7744440.1 maleylpyruvate isomerase family mycothiol-dependent enzyme [Phycicoccus avicenniae]
MSLTHLVRAERVDLLDLVRALGPAEWEMPSLCAGWRVRDVLAHVLSYEVATPREMLDQAGRGRFLLSGMNAAGVARLAGTTPDDLVGMLEAHLSPAGPPATLFGGRVGLTDALVHQQDIRRAVDRPRVVPAERLRPALTFALTAPPLRGAWRARGTRVVATDLDWSFGRGPEVRGPAEAVLMVLAGRPDPLGDLDGPGLPRLRQRLGS